MMRYKCERCGANLDPGEVCDCEREEKEPSCGNTDGSNGGLLNRPAHTWGAPYDIISEFVSLVKRQHNPVSALLSMPGAERREIVAFARSRYPKFDGELLEKCELRDEYGVTLVPELLDALILEFAPALMPAIMHERGGRHRLQDRFSCRVEPSLTRVIEKRMKFEHVPTKQALLAGLLTAYACDFWDSSIASELQKEYCHVHDVPQFAPSSGVCGRCGNNIYLPRPTANGGSTGISIYEAWTTHVTSCPHCHVTFCD